MTITIGDEQYTVLFPNLVRPLTPQERADLKASIEKYGVKTPVVVDEENGIIDGANRAQIATELGLCDLPTRTAAGLTDDEKRELAISLNADRRQLTPEDLSALRQERVKRVRTAREEGKSLRTIAADEGVSLGQVQRDLAESGVSGDTPETVADEAGDEPATTTPAVVTGRDGKKYTRGKKRGKQPKPCRIKGLVKEIKDLVDRGKVYPVAADRFAAQLDKEQQREFIAGKNDDERGRAIASWYREQLDIDGVSRMVETILYYGKCVTNESDSPKSDEGRQEILRQLTIAYETLGKIINPAVVAA